MPIDAVTTESLTRELLSRIGDGAGGHLLTMNLELLRLAKSSNPFHEIVKSASFIVADGTPLIWASKLQGTPLPERIAGSSFCLPFAGALASHGFRLFLLGGNQGIAEKASEVMRGHFPSLIVVGTYCPPYGFEKSDVEMERIRTALRETKPDVVYVALGSPKTEYLIHDLRGEFPQVLWIGVGISLSFMTGDVKRAPVWMQKLGLEWVHRLVQEPKRLFRRYIIDGIPFAIVLFASAMRKRVASGE